MVHVVGFVEVGVELGVLEFAIRHDDVVEAGLGAGIDFFAARHERVEGGVVGGEGLPRTRRDVGLGDDG